MRVSEVYVSTQGEGPNVGSTTVFTRFGGCNLRCPGWPCDTEFAIDPAYRKEWQSTQPLDLTDRVIQVAVMSGATNVTLTGGEPFLQSKTDLKCLVDELITEDYTIDCFSNGTIAYPDWAVEKITFIMDWKLPGSGEDHLDSVRMENLEKLTSSSRRHAVKFVIKDAHDMITAHSLWSVYLKDRAIDVYYGKVWDGDISDAELVDYVMTHQLPWKLNVQMHNYIWPRDERGR